MCIGQKSNIKQLCTKASKMCIGEKGNIKQLCTKSSTMCAGQKNRDSYRAFHLINYNIPLLPPSNKSITDQVFPNKFILPLLKELF